MYTYLPTLIFFKPFAETQVVFFLALPSLSSQKHCQATQGFKYNLTSKTLNTIHKNIQQQINKYKILEIYRVIQVYSQICHVLPS